MRTFLQTGKKNRSLLLIFYRLLLSLDFLVRSFLRKRTKNLMGKIPEKKLRFYVDLCGRLQPMFYKVPVVLQ